MRRVKICRKRAIYFPRRALKLERERDWKFLLSGLQFRAGLRAGSRIVTLIPISELALHGDYLEDRGTRTAYVLDQARALTSSIKRSFDGSRARA